MRGRGVLAQIFGLAPKVASEDAALLLTDPIVDLRGKNWMEDHEIWCAMDRPLKWVFRPEWENDYDPWPEDEGSALC